MNLARQGGQQGGPRVQSHGDRVDRPAAEDRKSTRLNSSHSQISYAVFCLKQKIVKGPIPPHWSHALPSRRLGSDEDSFISVAVQYELTSYSSKKLLVGAGLRTPLSGPSLL